MDLSNLPFFEGQRLHREEFHALYKLTPEKFRAELIDGVVYFKGRVGFRHGDMNATLAGWSGFYEAYTPGIQGGLHTSTVLGALSEVHPDVLLKIKSDRGGQTRVVNDILHGAPELVIEIADESISIDLGAKLRDYERAGTQEYVVCTIDPDDVFWHVLQGGRLIRTPVDPDGIFRSRVYPGLWLDLAALLADDGLALLATLKHGLASPEHAEFVARLAAHRP